MNNCDYGHKVPGEVRLLPCEHRVNGNVNKVVCHRHYIKELHFRLVVSRTKNEQLLWDFPSWDDLQVVKDNEAIDVCG